MGNSKIKSNSMKESFNCVSKYSSKELTIKSYRSTQTPNTEEVEQKHMNMNILSKRSRPRNISHDMNIDIDATSAKMIKREKKEDDINLIKKSLLSHFLFSYLPEENLETIIKEMRLYSLNQGEIVFYQGNPGYKFFILAKGSVEVIINGSVKTILYPGAGFGELALIHDLKRTATIRTKENSLMWGIGRKIFRETLKTLNTLNHEENKKFIKSVPFFQSLSDSQTNSLLSIIVSQSFSHGQKIIQEGDPGELFYIIQEGQVECSAKGQVIRSLSVGDYFGEQALIYNSPRTATVTAVNKVKVLSIGKDSLTEAVGDRLQFILYNNTLRIALDLSEHLRGLDKKMKENLIKSFEIFSFSKGEIAIPAGAMKNKYIWIVLKGKVVRQDGKVLERFENLGAKWAYYEKEGMIEKNWIADCDVDIGIIRKDAIDKVVCGKVCQKIQENYIISILKQVYLFRVISEAKLLLLAKAVKLVEFAENQNIFKQGDQGDSFFIIKQGEVLILKDEKVIRTVCKGNYFGERSILLNETRTASALSKTISSLWVISREEFLSIIDENIQPLLLKRIHLQDDTISLSLSDLYVIDNIGKGSFGNVYLTVKKQTRFLYALKSISRKKIKFYNLYDTLRLEKEVLQRLEHQFIIKFVKSFKDAKRIYFLLEYASGLSMYEVLRFLNVLCTSKCRFYASCLLLILEHLHQNSIVYRDLKPENLIVEPDGYLKLIDFGTAKIINSRTYSVIGTPHYMAPEVILGKGYRFSADIWSYGVMVYEMLCGRVPFGESEESDPFTIYKEIIAGTVNYPSFLNPLSRDFIQDLLSNKVTKRSSIEVFRSHKFFAGNDWELYLSRKKNPPYKPNCENYDKLVDCSLDQERSVEAFINRTQENSGLIENLNPGQSVSDDWDRNF